MHEEALQSISLLIAINRSNVKRYDGETGEWAGYADRCRRAIASLENSAAILQADHDKEEAAP